MNINLLFEQVSNEQKEIVEFNKKLLSLDEKKRNQCTIHPTDSTGQIRKKCRRAYAWGVYHEPMWNKYVEPQSEPTDTTNTDSGSDVGAGDGGGVDEIKPQNKDNAFAYPYSIGPEDDEEFTNEADSSTERVRRYYRRHPEKVRKYLKKTQDDRVARNRDRKKAVKKYGKEKMKNHDVHHPNGAQNGNWKLAKKDHGRDKKDK